MDKLFIEPPREKEAHRLYEQRFGRWYPDAVYRAKLVCSMLPSGFVPRRILDATGFFPSAFVFTQSYEQAEVMVYNLYEDDIIDGFRGTIKYRHGDITDIAFPDRNFDLVYLGEAIEHVYEIDKCFKEAARVLAPGGYLAITTPNLASWYNRLLLLFGRCPANYHPSPITRSKADLANLRAGYGNGLKNVPLHHFHIRVFTIATLIEYLETHGFKVVRYDIRNFVTPDRRFAWLRRSLNLFLPKDAREGITVVAKKEQLT